MINFNNLSIITFKDNTNIIKNYKNSDIKDFESIAVSSMFSIYLLLHKKYLESEKAFYFYNSFIQITLNKLSSFINKNTGPKKILFQQLLDICNNLRKDEMFSYKFNLNDFMMFMSNYEINDIVSNFYIPLFSIFDQTTISENEIVSMTPSIPRITSLDDGDIIIHLNTINGVFEKTNYKAKPSKLLVKYINSFKINFSEKSLINDIAIFFMQFKIDYLPDIKNSLGITEFTVFDIFFNIHEEENIFIDTYTKKVKDPNDFNRFFTSNDINNEKINNSLIKYSPTVNKNINTLFDQINRSNRSTGKQATEISIENLNTISIESLFNDLLNPGYIIALEADDDPDAGDDDPDAGDDDPDAGDGTDDTGDDNAENDEDNSDTGDDTGNDDDNNSGDDDNNDENQKEEPAKEKPSPIGLKITLADKDETIEDLVFKKKSYSDLKEYLHDEKISTTDKKLLKVILNQWFFLLDVKSIKKIMKIFTKLYSPEKV